MLSDKSKTINYMINVTNEDFDKKYRINVCFYSHTAWKAIWKATYKSHVEKVQDDIYIQSAPQYLDLRRIIRFAHDK